MPTEVKSITFENLEWINDDPITLAHRPHPSTGTTFTGRRSHKKSRLGCGNCKRRRVKCDESKPKCERCIEQRIVCDYPFKPPAPPDAVSEISPLGDPWLSATTTSMGSKLVESQLRSIVTQGEARLRSPPPPRKAGSSLVEAVHHFELHTGGAFGTADTQRTVRMRVLSLAQDSPVLMAAIVAFSANHLHTLRPDDQSMHLAAAHHSETALQLYSQELAGELTRSTVDSMIPACLLLSAVVFFSEDRTPSASFVFSDDPTAADCLQLLARLASLLAREDTKSALSQSMWMPLLTGCPTCTSPKRDASKHSRPECFVELRHLLNDDGTVDGDLCHNALRLPTQMMVPKANKESFATLMQFPCRMNPAFNALLREKDPAALLILAYWYAKLLEVDFWWLSARARSECYALCSWLDGWADQRFQPLLQYPMRACGYVPIDLDVIETCVFGM